MASTITTFRISQISLVLLVALICPLAGCGHDPQILPTSVAPTDPYADVSAPVTFDYPATVLRVIDGDTIEVELPLNSVIETIRFKGIDTPELHPDPEGSPPEPYAQRARSFALQEIGTDIGLEFDASCSPEPLEQCRDSFGRLLAYIRTSRGHDLAEEHLKRGTARVYVYRNEPFERLEAYRTIEIEARTQGLGIWQNESR